MAMRRIPQFGLIGVLLAACVSGCAGLAPTDAAKKGNWVASWGTAQMVPEGENVLADAQWRDRTLRQIVHLSLGGERVRVRLSNALGTAPLKIEGASVARAVKQGQPELVAGTARPLQFAGKATVTIAAGAEVFSDPVDLRVEPDTELAVSMHFMAPPERQTGHPGARGTNYVAPGQQLMEVSLKEATAMTRWYQLADIDVIAPAGAAAVVVIGDSITDGNGATKDANNRWTDYLARRLARSGMGNLGVVNAGIGGGRMLRDGLGPSLVSRFDRDVLGRSAVSHAIILIGVNDMAGLYRKGGAPAEHAQLLADLKGAYRQLAERAHRRGVCLIGGTIQPHGASGYYRPSVESERDRADFNNWLKTAGVLDGVIDFDTATRDPALPGNLQKAFDSGDGLHLSPAGFNAMAEAVPLDSLRSCRFAAKAAQP